MFSVLDYFTPYNYSALNSGDIDLGSAGVLLLDQPVGSPHQHLLFLCGKEGKLYVVDRDNMGEFNATGPYLRWRIETFSGLHAEDITARTFFAYCWRHRRELWRYLDWAARKGS